MRVFLGCELGSINSRAAGSGLQSSGQALGAFAGGEYHLSRRVSLAFDMGPALLSVTEKNLGTRDEGLDFVVNTALSYYFF